MEKRHKLFLTASWVILTPANHLSRMQEIEAGKNADRQFDGFSNGKFLMFFQKFVERAVGGVFAYDDDLAVVFVGFDDR